MLIETVTLPMVAVIVQSPAPATVICPVGPTVATDEFDELHTTCELTSFVDKSLYVAVAESCTFDPSVILGFDGEIARLVRVGLIVMLIVTTVFPSTPVIVAEPALIAVTRPDEFTLATAVFELLQVKLEVRFWVVPSLYVPVAVSWREAPIVRFPPDTFVIVMPLKAGVAAVFGVDFPPHPTRTASNIAVRTAQTRNRKLKLPPGLIIDNKLIYSAIKHVVCQQRSLCSRAKTGVTPQSRST